MVSSQGQRCLITQTHAPVMTRYDIRCQSAPWKNTTIYGSYSDAHKTASIISEECHNLGYITTVDILKEEGPNLAYVGQTYCT
jgi:hypothetical protein